MLKKLGDKNRVVCSKCGRVLSDDPSAYQMIFGEAVCTDCHAAEFGEYYVIKLNESDVEGLGFNPKDLDREDYLEIARHLEESLLIDGYWEELDKELVAKFNEKNSRKA